MSALKVVVCVAALTVFVAGLSPSLASDISWCGYKINLSCPGCTPQAGGSCMCKISSDVCKCRKQDGSEPGYNISCETNDFDFYDDPEGRVITQGELAPCKITKKCMRPNGSQIDCGNLVAGRGCIVEFGDGCAWRDFAVDSQRIYVEGGDCE